MYINTIVGQPLRLAQDVGHEHDAREGPLGQQLDAPANLGHVHTGVVDILAL
jgi:hypothetical protein